MNRYEIIKMLQESVRENQVKKISGPEDVFALCSSIACKKQEHFVVITLDGGHQVIRKRTVFIGTLNATYVHPREVFAAAIKDRAAAIIVVHNHPSGRLVPSEEDRKLTTRLKEAGEILGIGLLDSIIVSRNGFERVM